MMKRFQGRILYMASKRREFILLIVPSSPMQTLLALNQQTPLQKNFNLLTEPSEPVEYETSSSAISLMRNSLALVVSSIGLSILLRENRPK